MSNKIKDIDKKYQTYYFLNDIINIKNFDSDKVRIDEKSYENILIYYIGYLKIKGLKTNRVNPL